jgi:hypothetical protein
VLRPTTVLGWGSFTSLFGEDLWFALAAMLASLLLFIITFSDFVEYCHTKLPKLCGCCFRVSPQCLRTAMGNYYARGAIYVVVGVAGLALCAAAGKNVSVEIAIHASAVSTRCSQLSVPDSAV